jgi:hypothetical protein
MKLLLKFLIYSIALLVLVILALKVFSNHPHEQLLFIFPSVFLFAGSNMMDDILPNPVMQMRFIKGR